MYGGGGDGPTNGRIYVGSLPNMFTEKDVEREFERFGKIIKMDFKRTISGSGYCFLEYADPRDARDAIAQLHGRPPPGMRDAPPLRVEVPLSSRGGGEPGRGLPRGLTTRRGRFIVDIRGLPPTGSWQDLKDHFRRIGDVGYAEVWKDPESCDGSGVGEVSFFTRRDMMEAIEVLDGSTFRSHEGEKSRITVREKRIVGERDRDRGDRDRSDRGRPMGDSMGGRSEDDDYDYGARGDRGGGGGMRGSSRGGEGRKYSGGASNGGGGGYYGGGGGYHHHPDYNGSSSRRGGDGYYDYYHNAVGSGGGGSPSPPPRSGDSNVGSGRYYGGGSGGGGYYDGGGSMRGAGRGRSRSRDRGGGGGRQGPGGDRNYGCSSGRGADGGCHDAPYGDTMGNSSPSLRRAAAPGGRCMVEESIAAGGSRGKYEGGDRERRRS